MLRVSTRTIFVVATAAAAVIPIAIRAESVVGKHDDLRDKQDKRSNRQMSFSEFNDFLTTKKAALNAKIVEHINTKVESAKNFVRRLKERLNKDKDIAELLKTAEAAVAQERLLSVSTATDYLNTDAAHDLAKLPKFTNMMSLSGIASSVQVVSAFSKATASVLIEESGILDFQHPFHHVIHVRKRLLSLVSIDDEEAAKAVAEAVTAQDPLASSSRTKTLEFLSYFIPGPHILYDLYTYRKELVDTVSDAIFTDDNTSPSSRGNSTSNDSITPVLRRLKEPRVIKEEGNELIQEMADVWGVDWWLAAAIVFFGELWDHC